MSNIIDKVRNFFHRSKNPDAELQNVLKDCENASQEGYKMANTHLDEVRKSIVEAAKVISNCVYELDKSNYSDPNVKRDVKSQLDKVNGDFFVTYNKACAEVQKKHEETKLFNITVFGSTTAGKSTLMEILTKGNGASIGHGAQRTTRDVRSYKWKGMQVTDVPGIEAYGGEEDDKMAEAEAVYADLILFLIDPSNPSKQEADWYIKLQKKDKPIVCVFNYHMSLPSNNKKLLSNNLAKIAVMKRDSGTLQAIAQFKQFLGNQQIDEVIVHLLSAFLSQREKDPKLHQNLRDVSNFSELNRKIISSITHDGLLYRRRCYLSIVDAPVFEQMSQLFLFSTLQYDQCAQVLDSKREFDQWVEEFNGRMRPSIRQRVTAVFDTLRGDVPSFVDNYVEDEDASSIWENHVEQMDVESQLQDIMKDIVNDCQTGVSQRFKDLQRYLKMSTDLNKDTFFRFNGGRVTDWKHAIGMGSNIIAAGFGIAGIFFPPMLLASAIVGLVGWIFDSHSEKLERQKSQMTDRLNDSIDEMERQAQQSISKCYKENVLKTQNEAKSRFNSLAYTLRALTNSERQLALGLCKNHVMLSRQLVYLMVKSSGVSLKGVVTVARIPAKRCCIVVRSREAVSNKLVSILSQKLGNGEDVRFVETNPDERIEARAQKLLNYFKVSATCRLANADGGRQNVLYIPKKNYSQTDLDSILLVEQIVSTHIIPKSYGRS